MQMLVNAEHVEVRGHHNFILNPGGKQLCRYYRHNYRQKCLAYHHPVSAPAPDLLPQDQGKHRKHKLDQKRKFCLFPLPLPPVPCVTSTDETSISVNVEKIRASAS